jgi:hypothetical protein
MIKRTLRDYLNDAQNQWRQIPLDLLPARNAPDARSADAYAAVLAQFDVGASPRYRTRNGLTWCNRYVSDVTAAMGAELPHWIDANGRPTYAGTLASETTANALFDRLVAGVDGYAECTAEQAVARACAGHPTVVAWHSGSKAPGHIAMVEPAVDPRGVLVAQAGAVCGRKLPLRAAFGDRAVRYFWHQ